MNTKSIKKHGEGKGGLRAGATGAGSSASRLAVTDARDSLADLVNRAAYKGERVVLERRGRAMAALVSVEDLEVLEALEDAADLKAAREALADPANKERIPLDDIRARLGME